MPTTTIVTSAARTTSGNSAAVGVPLGRASVAVQVDVTAASGASPSMALTVEWSADGTTWFKSDPADSLTAITATVAVVKRLEAKGSFLRLAWAITGTVPSFTFAANLWFSGS